LEERVLLPGGRKLALEHDIGRGDRGFDIALPDRDVQQEVAVAVRVDAGGLKTERVFRIQDRGEVFPRHSYGAGTSDRGVRSLGDYEGDLVAAKPRFITDGNQHRLVMLDQAECIRRNVGGSEHRYHSRDALGEGCVDRDNPGARAMGEHDLGMQHAGTNPVGRIGR
jgi:hypothetical protein